MTDQRDYEKHRRRIDQLAETERQEAINNRRRERWAGVFAVIGAVVAGGSLGSGGGGLYWFAWEFAFGAVVGGILGLVIALVTERASHGDRR